MKIILFIINFAISFYGTAPIFTTCEALPDDREGQVYITVDYGICIDDSGNGMLYGYDSIYNYISYSKVESAKVGDEIYTFCILNPDTNDYDDIVCRIDVIANSNEIFIDMDDIKKQYTQRRKKQCYQYIILSQKQLKQFTHMKNGSKNITGWKQNGESDKGQNIYII